jgi:hypothetical protein
MQRGIIMSNHAKVNIGCGCMVIVALLNVTLGGVLFDYCLQSYFGKDIPWYGDAACGLVTAEFVLPFAIVAFILKLCGVASPFFGN